MSSRFFSFNFKVQDFYGFFSNKKERRNRREVEKLREWEHILKKKRNLRRRKYFNEEKEIWNLRRKTDFEEEEKHIWEEEIRDSRRRREENIFLTRSKKSMKIQRKCRRDFEEEEEEGEGEEISEKKRIERRREMHKLRIVIEWRRLSLKYEW